MLTYYPFDCASSTSPLSKLAPLEAILFDIDGMLCDSDPINYQAYREMLPEIDFNGGVPIMEEFYAEFISGKHNEDMATFFFPHDHRRGLKFTAEKEAMFRRILFQELKLGCGSWDAGGWFSNRKSGAFANGSKVCISYQGF
ncbi:hypothetical protein RHSIM_Rhsim11G0010800 [Rhododendron simsii]|uniref:Uncharacterized protein n=1 Tax=Rhododendron simsii TaxID=118357 RepID=A0A834L7R0_RHOSS|nr:hypothetical protein RHSIM_Rhsim11G0010800 [Rhododendron simsii]